MATQALALGLRNIKKFHDDLNDFFVVSVFLSYIRLILSSTASSAEC